MEDSIMMPREELALAAKKGDRGAVERIVSLNPNLLSAPLEDSEETALHLAAAFGHSGVVELLLDLGANVNAEAYYNYTSLDSAIRTKHDDIAALLRRRGGVENA